MKRILLLGLSLLSLSAGATNLYNMLDSGPLGSYATTGTGVDITSPAILIRRATGTNTGFAAEVWSNMHNGTLAFTQTQWQAGTGGSGGTATLDAFVLNPQWTTSGQYGAAYAVLETGYAAAGLNLSALGVGSTVNIYAGATPTNTKIAAFSLTGVAVTGTLLATGIADGKVPVDITTTTPITLGGTYKTGYTFNNTTATTYNLPTAAAGLQYCVKNYTTRTGIITVATSAAGQYIDYVGVNTASGGNVTSGGALGDGACFVGADATHWVMYNSLGTWTVH